jgi:hypothetical protein
MPNIPPKPLLLLARLDSETDLRWFVRLAGAHYQPWPPQLDECGNWIDPIEPHRLIPATVDFSQPRGDNAAIVECHNARDKYLERSKS